MIAQFTWFEQLDSINLNNSIQSIQFDLIHWLEPFNWIDGSNNCYQWNEWNNLINNH